VFEIWSVGATVPLVEAGTIESCSVGVSLGLPDA
jgi:hypothetical protein